MTVGHIENGKYYCDWHDRDGHNQVMGVLEVCLRKISTGDRVDELLSELEGLSSETNFILSPRGETKEMQIGDLRLTTVR